MRLVLVSEVKNSNVYRLLNMDIYMGYLLNGYLLHGSINHLNGETPALFTCQPRPSSLQPWHVRLHYLDGFARKTIVIIPYIIRILQRIQALEFHLRVVECSTCSRARTMAGVTSTGEGFPTQRCAPGTGLPVTGYLP